jgi:hypothetical protein
MRPGGVVRVTAHGAAAVRSRGRLDKGVRFELVCAN